MNSDQHKATLNELHREIDRLKLQNKDQQWRLVLNGASSPTEVLQETVSNQIQPNPLVFKDFRLKWVASSQAKFVPNGNREDASHFSYRPDTNKFGPTQ